MRVTKTIQTMAAFTLKPTNSRFFSHSGVLSVKQKEKLKSKNSPPECGFRNKFFCSRDSPPFRANACRVPTSGVCALLDHTQNRYEQTSTAFD